jgi:effector-binding domain-containing protein
MKAVRRLWLPLAGTMALGAIALGGIALGALMFGETTFGVIAPSAVAQGAGPNPPPAGAPADPFGAEVMLTEKTIVYLAGSGLWDSAFETITNALQSVAMELDKRGVKANGPLMIIYTATDDTGFVFEAAAPVAEAPNALSGEIKVGKSPTGKALKFVHRGSYDSMDTTYEAITNYLDDKRLEARDLFIEQYMKDPLKTPEDDLVIEVYVPLK